MDDLDLYGNPKNTALTTLYSDDYKSEIRFCKVDEDTIEVLVWDSIANVRLWGFKAEARDVESIACCLVNELRR